MPRRSQRERVFEGVDPHSVVDLAGSPRVFIPLWPFVDKWEFTPSGPRVVFVIKRFALKVRAAMDVDVMVDEAARKVVYRASSKGKLFIVTMESDPVPGGSRVILHAEYTGTYEKLSQPILDEFTASLLGRLEGLARSQSPPEGGLSSPERVAWALLHGTPKLSMRERVEDEAQAALLVERLSAYSEGSVVLARLYAEDGLECVRIHMKDGDVENVYHEASGKSAEDRRLAQKLPKILAGKTWIVKASQVPRL